MVMTKHNSGQDAGNLVYSRNAECGHRLPILAIKHEERRAPYFGVMPARPPDAILFFRTIGSILARSLELSRHRGL
jgi:hypothetical protein